MVLHATASNLSEALINVKKYEQNFQRQFRNTHRERNKIRAAADRHMETFLQMVHKRHETWYRHDKHFREALKKEKESHEKRKDRDRHQQVLANNPEYVPSDLTPFQPVLSESMILQSTTMETPVLPSNVSPIPIVLTPRSPLQPPPRLSATTPTMAAKTTPTAAATITAIPKNMNTSTVTTPRPEPLTKVQRRTHQVLRASQKLLDESAAQRSIAKCKLERRLSASFNQKPSPLLSSSSSSLFYSPTFTVPMITEQDDEDYDRLINESLRNETFGDFVDHFFKFRPEYREQFGLINEARKRERAIEKLREFNQVHAKTKDQRYHRLISSLTDLRSEEKEKISPVIKQKQ